LVLIVEDYSSLHLDGRFEDEARGNEILESDGRSRITTGRYS
jgi:hypothetical protein